MSTDTHKTIPALETFVPSAVQSPYRRIVDENNKPMFINLNYVRRMEYTDNIAYIRWHDPKFDSFNCSNFECMESIRQLVDSFPKIEKQ